MTRSSYPGAKAVTPDDTNDLDPPAKAIYVGGAGDLTIIDGDGNTRTTNNIVAGSTVEVKATRVLATGTTATEITALF